MMRGVGWGATHVLAYEREGRMLEVLVRLDRQSLYTAEEWTGHEVAEWTFEEDGKLYYCGEDYAATMGKCGLRPLGAPRLRLDDVLAVVERMWVQKGKAPAAEVARELGRDLAEVERSFGTLARLRLVERDAEGCRKL